MDKKERIKVITRIGDLIEHKCSECEFNGATQNRNNQNFCREMCNIGKELAALGEKLNPPETFKEKLKRENKRLREEEKKERKPVKGELTKEVYEDLKAQGKSDKKIMNIYQMNNANFYNLKKAWGLVGKAKEIAFNPKKLEPQDVIINDLKHEIKQLKETLDNERIERQQLEIELKFAKEKAFKADKLREALKVML